jgi:hypothetical protein
MYVERGTKKVQQPRDGKLKMEFGRHAMQGDISGNPDQPEGKHIWGVEFIPLGDRYRDRPEFGFTFEERESIDKYTKLHGK